MAAVGIASVWYADDLLHRPADAVEIGLLTVASSSTMSSRLQRPMPSRGPGDVRHLLIVRALRVAARSGSPSGREKIARRVAFAAMHDGVDEVVAAVPLGNPTGDRKQPLVAEKNSRRQPNCRKRQRNGRPTSCRLLASATGSAASDIVEIGDVLIAHRGERG